MSEELRAWLNEIREDQQTAQKFLSDDDPEEIQKPIDEDIPALITKCEELAEALQDLMDHQNGPPLPNYEAGWNAAMEAGRKALRVPGDDDRELVYIDYCSCVIPQATHAVPTRCYACGREIKPGGGES